MRKWCVASIWAVAAAVPTHADVLLSNFSASTAAGTFFGTGSLSVFKAAGFTIGPGAYALGSVKLSMSFAGGGNCIVSIWQGSGMPQTLVQTLAPPSLAGSGDFVFTPTSPLTLNAGTTYWVYVSSVANPTGSFIWDGTSPSTPPTGIATFAGFIYNGSPSPVANRLEVIGAPVGGSCYPNCDGSTTPPVLTGNDFQCFLTRFVAGESYANCDGSTVSPVLTGNDFQCFLTAFVAGCT